MHYVTVSIIALDIIVILSECAHNDRAPALTKATEGARRRRQNVRKERATAPAKKMEKDYTEGGRERGRISRERKEKVHVPKTSSGD